MAATTTRRSSGPVIRSLSPSGRFHSPSGRFHSPSAPSIRFTPSPSKSIATVHSLPQPTKPIRRTCMCSPTTHPGSFRCALHKNVVSAAQTSSSSYPSNRLNARRSAMTNSLVRIGTVEGEIVKRALTALIRPSSHHQKRRGNFKPRPSRLSAMSKAEY